MLDRNRNIYGIILFLFIYLILPVVIKNTINSGPHAVQLIHISAIIFWILSIRRRVIQKRIRRYLAYMGISLAGIIFLQYIKYNLIVDTRIDRYFWYLTYWPLMWASTFSMFASLFIGRMQDERLESKWFLLWTPCMVILALVLTNDLHFLAFHFPKGLEVGSKIYRHGPVWVMTLLWIYGGMMLSFVHVIRTSAVVLNKTDLMKALTAPLFCVCFLILYIMNGGHNIYRISFQEIYVFMFISFWESFIQIGIIPSNSGYRLYFKESHLYASLFHKDRRLQYHSVNAKILDEQSLEEAQRDNNILVHCKEITGGHIYWTEGIARLRRLEAALEEVKEALMEERDLIEAENKLKEEQETTRAQNQIYESIYSKVTRQREKVTELLEEAKRSPVLFNKNMALASLFTVYIKRRANLELHAVKAEKLSVKELVVSIRESLDYLKRCDVHTMFDAAGDGFFSNEAILEGYELFERIVEAGSSSMVGLMVKIRAKENHLVLSMTMEQIAEIEIPAGTYWKISEEVEDETIYLTLTLDEEVPVC